MSSDKVTISISREVYEKVQKYIQTHGGFNSVEEFIEFVINEVLSEESAGPAYSKEDEEKIKERLRALGYL